MDENLKCPPRSKDELTPGPELAKRLACLIEQPYRLTQKTRTDGSNLRKLVATTLVGGKLPPAAAVGSWECPVPKKKGVPRIMREFLETSIVTTGDSYNLQVWNRNPSEPTPQIEYADTSVLRANDVRFVFVPVDPVKQKIKCVIVATPDYIVTHFGKFGVPTVKQQLMITETVRCRLLAKKSPVVFHPDDDAMVARMPERVTLGTASIGDLPNFATLLALTTIRDLVVPKLIGHKIEPSATRYRGQQLESLVATLLGYEPNQALLGGYPDLRHQALEVKIQDAAMVDLGRCSPQFEAAVTGCPGFTTQSVRYLIALTNKKTGVCEGIVLCPGKRLAEHFVYVASESFKCQRSIPMAFFDKFAGKAVFNPAYP